MKGRLNGVVYRGDAVYYTFQRAKTGSAYLKKLADSGKNLKEFRVTMTRDGKEVKKSANEFQTWASKLKDEPVASTNGKGKAKSAKKSTAKKPAAKKAARVVESSQASAEL